MFRVYSLNPQHIWAPTSSKRFPSERSYSATAAWSPQTPPPTPFHNRAEQDFATGARATTISTVGVDSTARRHLNHGGQISAPAPHPTPLPNRSRPLQTHPHESPDPPRAWHAQHFRHIESRSISKARPRPRSRARIKAPSGWHQSAAAKLSPRPVEAASTECSKLVRPLDRGPIISAILPRGQPTAAGRVSSSRSIRHPTAGTNAVTPFLRLLAYARPQVLSNDNY